MYFFTSDTHFGGDSPLRRENRPFRFWEDYRDFQVEVWNSQAGPNDTIIHLGDFINYNDEEIIGWREAISTPKLVKAPIILVIGNNEQRVIDNVFKGDFQKFKEFCIKNGFQNVCHSMYLTICGQKFFLNHFPSKHRDDCLNLFGHVHRATGLYKPFGFNINTDLNHFFLFSEDLIARMIAEKAKFWDVDEDVQS